MKLIIKVFGILFILIGISILIKPDIIIGWLDDNKETTSLYIIAIVFRLAMGLLLVFAAKQSRYPGIINFLGYLTILAAIIFLLMGHDTFMDFVSDFIPDIKPYAPVIGVFAMAMGVFLVYAFSDNKKLNNET